MNSCEAIIFEAILQRLMTVPDLRYIEQDLGQLENYDMRPAVSWPCALLEIDDFDFSDAENNLVQIAEGFLQVRIGLVKYTDSNNLTPANIRPNGYRYMEVADLVAKALHGWQPPGCTRLIRRNAVTEKRDDDIRVKVLRFAFSYKEDLAQAKAIAPRPSVVIETSVAR